MQDRGLSLRVQHIPLKARYMKMLIQQKINVRCTVVGPPLGTGVPL